MPRFLGDAGYRGKHETGEGEAEAEARADLVPSVL